MPLLPSGPCRSVLRARLHDHIFNLELQRRGFRTSIVTLSSPKSCYISSHYVDTLPPSTDQLNAAAHFFTTHTPSKTWTATEWRRHISQHSNDLIDIVPEIAFLGRSNSGKSSLMNALLSSPGLCRVGPRPGKTTIMHAWSLSRTERGPRTKRNTITDPEPKLTVLDMPGYGHGSREEWGLEIIKYMRRRRQLRRAFLLLNPKHGVKPSDEQILRVLRQEGIAHQIVACKCDDLKASEFVAKVEELHDAVTRSAKEEKALGLVLSDVLAIGHLGDGKANQRVEQKSMRGVDSIRWAILQATGLERYAIKQLEEDIELQKDKRPLRVIEPRAADPKTNHHVIAQ